MKRNHFRSIIYTGVLVAMLVVLALSLSGCTTYDNFRQAFIDDPEDVTDTINIGVYEPLAGADKDAAEPEVCGIELAHKMFPEAADGRKVNLIYADNNSNINAAETAISTLLTKNPSVILGSYGNLYSLLAGEYIKEAEVPAITMTNTNPLITRNNSYYFRICYIDATQGKLLANYLNHEKVKKAGVLLPEKDDAALALATAFTNALRDLTDEDDPIGYYEKYTTGEMDFTGYLNTLKESGVKYVFLPGEVPDALNIITQSEKMGLDVTFLGDMTWGSEDFRKGLSVGINPERLAFVQFFATDGNDKKPVVNQAREDFLEAYRNEYGDEEPEEAVALGYDAYRMALDAIAKATQDSPQLASGQQIRDVLLGDDYQFEGASGIIRFNKNGDPKKTAYISTWEGNAVKAIYTIETNQQ